MKTGLLGSSGRIAMQVPAFKLSACSRVTGKPEVISSQKASLGHSGLLNPG